MAGFQVVLERKETDLEFIRDGHRIRADRALKGKLIERGRSGAAKVTVINGSMYVSLF